MTFLKSFAMASSAAVALGMLMSSAAVAQTDSALILSQPGGHPVHVFPTFQLAKQLGMVHGKDGKNTPTTPALTYHGGPVMQPDIKFYVVYWQPPALQDGSATSIPSGYKTVLNNLVGGYGGHSISAINTQYYQGSSPKTYITGNGHLVQSVVDGQPYPVSGCAATIGVNCFTDAQLKAEVQRFVGAKGWTPGYDTMFLFFTSKGEGSCFDTTVNYCSTETANVNPYYCAYHSYTGGSNNIIFSNEPFGNPTYCLGGGTQPNSTLGGPEADPASTAASHEISEAITDPNLNAWWDSANGQENGDLCAYNYGTNGWQGGNANQMWGGKFFEVQMEYSNHHARCEQVGP